MRPPAFLLLLLGLAAACGEGDRAAVAAAGALPVLRAGRLRPGVTITVDGMAADEGWRRARELVVPLQGPGVPEVRVKAVHDGKRLYLLFLWPDPGASLNRYWEYTGHLTWKRSETEDGLSLCWSPGSEQEAFRAQGCALCGPGGPHHAPGAGAGAVDFWYFGAQTTKFHPEARDMWLRRGDNQRLRGDNQPEGSDNLLNVSDRYQGPRFFPTFRRKGDDRVLFHKRLKEVTPEWIEEYWKDELNLGRQVPLDILRPRRGSRGDVANASRYHKGKGWVLELARDFETSNPDDLPLGDPLVPVCFAIAINDDARGPNHAMSGPIELSFGE